MMKLALIAKPVRHLAGNVTSPRARTLVPTGHRALRKASQGSGGGEEERNLPATSQRGSSLGLTGLGLSSPFSSRFREMEQEMEVSFLVTFLATQ